MSPFDLMLFLSFQAALAFFIYRVIAMLVFCLRDNNNDLSTPRARLNARLLFKIAGEIVTFLRLLKANEWVWIGEWLFHLSLAFIFLRHLRYFLSPVPDFIHSMQTPGIIAGYVLLAALLYILIVKVIIQRKPYIQAYNIFLISLLLLLSSTGLMMKIGNYEDMVDVKVFALGLVAFNPQPAPQSLLFKIHFLASVVLLWVLPLHIFAAPQSIADSVRRDEALKGIIHG